MISEFISEAEAFKSSTAIRLKIDNTTNDAEVLANMKHVAKNIFDPLRRHFNRPIGVSSFYRSPKLNKAIKGSATSQHCTGEAIDIDADIFGGLTNKEIFEWVKNNLEYDQLINEYNYSWVHVSLKRNGKNRKQILNII